MAIITDNPVSLVPATQQSAGAIKDIATRLVNAAKTRSEDDPIGLTGRALNSIQTQLNAQLAVLKSPIPLPQNLILTDATGRQIAEFGFTAMNSQQIYGLAELDLVGNLAAFVGVSSELPLVVNNTSNGSPDVITIVAHGYVEGDTLLIQGSTGDTAINQAVIVEPPVTANTFQIRSVQTLALINGNGVYAGGGTATRYFAGGWFQQIRIGGTSPSTAKIRAAPDGDVFINGATVTLDLNGVTTTIGNIAVGAAGHAGIDVKNDTAPSQDILVTDIGFYIRATDQATYVGILNAQADNGTLSLFNIAGTASVSLGGSNGHGIFSSGGTQTSIVGNLVTTGTLNALLALQTNGVTVVDSAQNATFHQISVGTWGLLVNSTGDLSANSLTINAGNAIVASSGNASFAQVSVSGGIRIDTLGNLHSANGATGSATVVTSVNFVAQTVTTATITATDGIVTAI